MKLPGFIGPAYTLDSLNVDCQRLVNMYPEVIESGHGKDNQVAYFKSTPGLKKLISVGDGPIRCVHVDSIGRIFVVSKDELYKIEKGTAWRIVPTSTDEIADIDQSTDIGTLTDSITKTSHGYYTGLKVQVSSTDTLPTGLSADTDYWVVNLTDDSFCLATSLANALSATLVDITAHGSGTMTVTPTTVRTKLFHTNNIDSTNDDITITSHGYYTGLQCQIPTVSESSGGIDSSDTYYVIKSDDDTIKLATSLSNASSSNGIDITSVSGDWTKTRIGSNGTTGGDEVLFKTSSGPVKASSMSFNGDGKDSSTIFVDGKANYLFKQASDNTESFGLLSDTTVVEADFTVNGDDFKIANSDSPDDWSGQTVNIDFETPANGAINVTYISIFDFGSGSELNINVNAPLDKSYQVTTKEAVDALNGGNLYDNITIQIIGENDPEFGRFINFRISPGANNLSTYIFSGGGGHLFAPASGSLTLTETYSKKTYSGADFGGVPNSTSICWIDGYFILNEGGTNKFFVSDLASFNIDTLSFSSSEGDPDLVLAVTDNNRELWVFNERSTEIYADTGNSDFPFERVPGGFLEIGCYAKYSVAKINGTVCWLGRTKEGNGIIYAASGLSPTRISTHAIEQAIQNYADPTTATAFTYQHKGHFFYVLNFDEATWVYDFKTKTWHERAYSNQGTLERHRVNFHAYAPNENLHIVGDYDSANIYQFDDKTYSDNGTEIIRLRSAPHLSSEGKRIFYKSFKLDMETGIGLDGDVQGSDPQVILQWSDDHGHTWSDEQWTSAGGKVGEIGDYKKRVIWRRLGSSRDRVFQVKITDPVPVTMIAAYFNAEKGAS